MNTPHDYRPALRSADMPPIDTASDRRKPKILQATVGITGKGFMSIQHAARGYRFAFIESGQLSRWWFKRGGSSPELFADLITKSDANGRRWRIVEVISAQIVSQG
jgi:hypothetical protein